MSLTIFLKFIVGELMLTSNVSYLEQWLFKMNGYDVAPEAYIIYYNGKKNEPFFDKKLEFDEHVIKLNCSTVKKYVGPKPVWRSKFYTRYFFTR